MTLSHSIGLTSWEQGCGQAFLGDSLRSPRPCDLLACQLASRREDHGQVSIIMPVLTIQFSSMEHDAFHVPYLSDTIPEAAFHGQAVKTVAYLRVSTAQQDLRSQRLAILEYARKHDFRIDDFIEATASGQASEKRRRLDELMSVLQRGDRLVVSELSRLGRSLGQIVAILDALAKAGIAKITGVSRTTLYSFMSTRGLGLSP